MISNYFFMCVAAKALVCFAALFTASITKKGKKMNLKEKWTKQNNSVKMLLRKLKRHDTVVVGVAVVIAVILCGGLIYLSTPVVAASAKDELVEAQGKESEQTIEKLDELSEYLNGLDKSITESKDSMTSFYEKDGEKNTEKMTNTVTEKVGSLGKDLSSLHETITRTGTDIDSLREMIEKGSEESDKSITEKFTNIYNNLEEIENTYNQTHENTKSLIEEVENALKSGDEKLSKDLLERYTELLAKLNESNESLSKQNSDNLKEFKEEIGSLNDQLTKRLNELSVGINTNIDNQFTTMNVSFENDMTGLKTFLAGEMASVNYKVDQVFQRVSNGKKLLASALLTKNVQIREDATFKEIAKAIESIPVKIVLDKDDVPGKVIYDYHYHIDGMGNVCDEEYVPIENKGGCYTEEYLHSHTDECYITTVYYSYRTDRDVDNLHYARDNWDGKAIYRFRCNHCHYEFEGTNGYHTESTTNYSVAQARQKHGVTTHEQKTLICTKPVGTLMGYKTSCNLLHGQVVAAKVVFSEGYEKYNTSTELINTAPVQTSLLAVPQRANGSRVILWDDEFDIDLQPVETGKQSVPETDENTDNIEDEGKEINENKENDNETKDQTSPEDSDNNSGGDDSKPADPGSDVKSSDNSETKNTDNSDTKASDNGDENTDDNSEAVAPCTGSEEPASSDATEDEN